ncbi:BadF/BadG/BcrA/BcrD ATPase family protein [Lapidilactobacillus achengensis]|uniref:BadF/BadG/BcrA/BcrD ATPase family protein n=1 Tax=Lapidilactobacillus achengensis TaxID=2486000 RepID=A0ABW1URE1_9LACO|nr:BadF/BadG/BcrA/BcrD ATPase family protein [Lapidilactobacillus achengensis]
MSFIIGIDSGGTHIVGQAFDKQGEVAAEAYGGVGNILLNPQETIADLRDVLNQLFHKLLPDNCDYILIGIAGVETTGNSENIAQEIGAEFGTKTYVISDAQLALLNGLKGHDGTLIIAGTGSVIYGRQQRQLIRCGGWGNLLGDTGSAYKITEQAMRIILQHHDLGKESNLLPTILISLNAADVKQAVRNYYSTSRKDIAAIAEEIAAASEHGIQDATDALSLQAEALATEALGLFDRYEQPIPKKIALSGSVLVHNAFYRQTLVNRLRQVYPDISAFVVQTNNARGAIFWSRWQTK